MMRDRMGRPMTWRQRLKRRLGDAFVYGMVVLIILAVLFLMAAFAALPYVLGALGIKWVFS